MPPIVWKKVPGSARKWELVYAKKMKEIIWGWWKRIGHTALFPSTFWHLPFPENPATAEGEEEMAINLHAGALPHKSQLFSEAAFQPISPPITQLCWKARGAQQKEGQDPQQPPEALAGSRARAELSSAHKHDGIPHQLPQQRDVLINTVSRNREKAYFDLD